MNSKMINIYLKKEKNRNIGGRREESFEVVYLVIFY